jgi:eukaryotic-like serine/threonine-protein kinase
MSHRHPCQWIETWRHRVPLLYAPCAPERNTVEEQERLAAVRRYDILDTSPDRAFDRITAIAARLMNVPVAIISIVNHDRIWFKSTTDLTLRRLAGTSGFAPPASSRTVRG